MKKLKTKVFAVIFIILTSFTFIIFLTSTTKSYIEKKNSIMDTLTKMPKTFERIPNENTDTMVIYFTSGTTDLPKMVN